MQLVHVILHRGVFPSLRRRRRCGTLSILFKQATGYERRLGCRKSSSGAACEWVARRQVAGQVGEDVVRRSTSCRIHRRHARHAASVDKLSEERSACTGQASSNSAAIGGGHVHCHRCRAENEVIATGPNLGDRSRLAIGQTDVADNDVAVAVEVVAWARRELTVCHTLRVVLRENRTVAHCGDASRACGRVDEVELSHQGRRVRVHRVRDVRAKLEVQGTVLVLAGLWSWSGEGASGSAARWQV